MNGKKVFTTILSLMVLCFTACENGNANAEVSNVILQERINEDLVYFAANMDLELESQVSSVDFKVYGTNVYYPSGNSIVNYSAIEEEKTVDHYQWPDAPGEWALQRVSYSSAGEVYALVSVGGDGDKSAAGAAADATDAAAEATLYLCKFNADRNLVFAKSLSEYFKESHKSHSAQRIKLEVGPDGRVYVSTAEAILIFESDGKDVDTVSFGKGKDVHILDFQGDAEKKLYVLYKDNTTGEQYVAEIDVEKKAVTAVQQTIGLSGIGVSDDVILGYNGATVYTYDRETFELTELFKWDECNVTEVTIYSVKQLADGRILTAAIPSWGGVETMLVKSILPDAGIASESGKTVIRVALYGKASSELEALAYRYNKNSELYEVVLDNYRSAGDEEAIARLKAELAAGKGPDIISMDFGNVRSMVENMYLEDLYRYLEKSEEVSEGDFLNFATEAYKIDGTLVAIPQRFNMRLLVGNAEVLGESSGWTMEEYLDFLEENAGNTVHAGTDTTVQTICQDVFRLNSEFFLDWDTCTCNFDNDIFRKLVEVAEMYPLDYVPLEEGETWAARLQSGKAVLNSEIVSSFYDLQQVETILGDAINYIGFPTEEGIGVWAWMEDALGISFFSENKEGAWEFLEDFYQLKASDPRMVDFPTYTPNLELYANWFMNQQDLGKWGLGKDIKSMVDFHIPDQEEINRYIELIELAQPGFNEYRLINDILVSEMGYYYEGKQTMDEMLENIEGQVVEYMKEHR